MRVFSAVVGVTVTDLMLVDCATGALTLAKDRLAERGAAELIDRDRAEGYVS
jgi:hypothetical protein